MDATLGRRLAAEAIGTGRLIVLGPGSVVAALRVRDGELGGRRPGMTALSFGQVVGLVTMPPDRT
jgi:glycerol uptake facilitator-like aquaporin